MGTVGNIAAILNMKPSVILGVPSYVYHVLRRAKEEGCRLDFVKKIVLGASRITRPFKTKLTELLTGMGASDVTVFGTYGFTEARSAWAECPTPPDVSSGYFLYPDKEIFEVIDPRTGEVQKEGEDGELVYTSLDSRGSSVIRYRTGDYVRGGMTYEPSPYSNLKVPRISSDITRLSNVKSLQLSKVKGCLVNLNYFAAILSSHAGLQEWQLEIRKRNDDPFDMDELVLYLCAREESDPSHLQEVIIEKIRSATEVSPNAIHFISLTEMVDRLELESANKVKRIIDRRPQS